MKSIRFHVMMAASVFLALVAAMGESRSAHSSSKSEISGGAAGIAEMLLQSHEGWIDLLPALPKALAQGSFRGLRARGGFEVAAEWAGGVLDSVEMRSSIGGVCRVRYSALKAEFQTRPGGVYVLDGRLKKRPDEPSSSSPALGR